MFKRASNIISCVYHTHYLCPTEHMGLQLGWKQKMQRGVIWGLDEGFFVPKKLITDKSYITREKQPLQRKDGQVAL